MTTYAMSRVLMFLATLASVLSAASVQSTPSCLVRLQTLPERHAKLTTNKSACLANLINPCGDDAVALLFGCLINSEGLSCDNEHDDLSKGMT